MFAVLNLLSFIKIYLDSLNDEINKASPSYKLTKAQYSWLGFVLSALLVTNCFCWDSYVRASLGKHKSSALRWVFKYSKLPWDRILIFSIRALIKRYNLGEGVLVIDDSDIPRSKNTTNIYGVQKLKDKASGGFIQGQNIVFLLLVTDKITIPVGFDFYVPDPEWLEWKKKDRELRKAKVSKKNRPPEPPKSPEYPSKSEIASQLIKAFQLDFPDIKIKAVLADCFYGNKNFTDKVSLVYPKSQVISQIGSNQLVKVYEKKISVKTLFERYDGIPTIINIRGERQTVTMRTIRIEVNSYGCKLMVIALKYEGEDDYRYIIATNLSWRGVDVVNAYTLRWLVEVFFQDWKATEGWKSKAMQQGEIGSRRGVTLSLLSDHALLMHHEQTSRVDAGLPAVTAGSLCHHIKIEAFLDAIKSIIESDSPKSSFEKLSTELMQFYELRKSKKHLVGFDMSDFKGRYALEKKYQPKSA